MCSSFRMETLKVHVVIYYFIITITYCFRYFDIVNTQNPITIEYEIVLVSSAITDEAKCLYEIIGLTFITCVYVYINICTLLYN